jgi:hypothetical protein
LAWLALHLAPLQTAILRTVAPGMSRTADFTGQVEYETSKETEISVSGIDWRTGGSGAKRYVHPSF